MLPLQLSAKVTLPAIVHRQHGAAATERCENLGQGQTRQGRERSPLRGTGKTLRGDGLRIGRLGGCACRPPWPAAPIRSRFRRRQPVELKNVLIGEVWLCSGAVQHGDARCRPGAELRTGDEGGAMPTGISACCISTTPPARCRSARLRFATAAGRCARANTIADFSATGYFFGKELYKNLGIPIGLIESCWGRDVRRVVDERRSAVRDALFPSPRREGEADPRIPGGA